MVRLKATFSDCAKFSAVVSIPYGTIKSELGEQKGRIHLQFQFLMVRLKAASAMGHKKRSCVVSIPYGTIKSLIMTNNLISATIVSIPYGTIKRKKRRSKTRV